MSGFGTLVGERWDEVSATVELDAPAPQERLQLITDLANQLDDDVLVDADGPRVLLARIPASHGTAWIGGAG